MALVDALSGVVGRSMGFDGLRGFMLGMTKDVKWKEPGAEGKHVLTVRGLLRGITSVEFEMKTEQGISPFYRHLRVKTPEIATISPKKLTQMDFTKIEFTQNRFFQKWIFSSRNKKF